MTVKTITLGQAIRRMAPRPLEPLNQKKTAGTPSTRSFLTNAEIFARVRLETCRVEAKIKRDLFSKLIVELPFKVLLPGQSSATNTIEVNAALLDRSRITDERISLLVSFKKPIPEIPGGLREFVLASIWPSALRAEAQLLPL